MGGAKRMLEEHERKLAIATQIAVEAGALKTCELHDDTYMEGDRDVQEAYKLGNTKFTKGDIAGEFESRTEMTDYIKRAVEELASDECGSCARWRDD